MFISKQRNRRKDVRLSTSPPPIIDRDVRDRNTIDLPSWNAFDGSGQQQQQQQQFGNERSSGWFVKKRGKCTVERSSTRLFIPINSLPSRRLESRRGIFLEFASRSLDIPSDPLFRTVTPFRRLQKSRQVGPPLLGIGGESAGDTRMKGLEN